MGVAAVVLLGQFMRSVADCLEVDGKFGKATKTAFQTWLNDNGGIPAIKVDGVFDAQSTTALQNCLNTKQTYAGLKVDGDFGSHSRSSHSVRVLQLFLHRVDSAISIDGWWKDQTTRRLQDYLKSQGFDPDEEDIDISPLHIQCPWSQGPEINPCPKTKMALQNFLISQGLDVGPVDGLLGSKTATAFQTYLNEHTKLNPDGSLGHDTIAALQYFLNHQEYGLDDKLLIDGDMGSATTEHLQTFLNAEAPCRII